MLVGSLRNCPCGAPSQETDGDLSSDEIREAYEAIRRMSLDSTNVVQVDSCSLQRDVGDFTFESGYLYFFEPTLDKVVAAFFKGKGVFRLSTDNKTGKQQLRRFTDRDTCSLQGLNQLRSSSSFQSNPDLLNLIL